MNSKALELATLRTFVESSPVLCLAADKNFITTYVNPFYLQIHNIHQHQAVGKHIRDIIGEEGFNDNLCYYQRTLAGETVEYDASFFKLDGSVHYYRAVYAPIFHEGEIEGLTGVVIDITSEKEIEKANYELLRVNEELTRVNEELRQAKNKLAVQASTDSLTRLYNRRYFSEISDYVFALAKRTNNSFTVLMADIDEFKNINDSYGHKAGDQVIIQFSKILQQDRRKSDITCRFGGEEFAVLLPETDIGSALLVAENMRKKASQAEIKLADGKKISFTVSIGISVVMLDADNTVEAALHRADLALYQAKSDGRNKTCIAE